MELLLLLGLPAALSLVLGYWYGRSRWVLPVFACGFLYLLLLWWVIDNALNVGLWADLPMTASEVLTVTGIALLPFLIGMLVLAPVAGTRRLWSFVVSHKVASASVLFPVCALAFVAFVYDPLTSWLWDALMVDRFRAEDTSPDSCQCALVSACTGMPALVTTQDTVVRVCRFPCLGEPEAVEVRWRADAALLVHYRSQSVTVDRDGRQYLTFAPLPPDTLGSDGIARTWLDSLRAFGVTTMRSVERRSLLDRGGSQGRLVMVDGIYYSVVAMWGGEANVFCMVADHYSDHRYNWIQEQFEGLGGDRN